MRYARAATVLSVLAVAGCGGGDSGNATGPNVINNSVTVTMQTANLPSDVTYNHAAHDFGMEYMWAATFDVDNNGYASAGDLQLNVQHYKFSGAATTVAPLADIDAKLWIYTSETNRRSTVPLRKTINGNTITLSIDKSDYSGLDAVRPSTPVNFSSQYYEPALSTWYNDDYPTALHGPASGPRFTTVPADGRMTDVTGDVQAAMVDFEVLTAQITP